MQIVQDILDPEIPYQLQRYEDKNPKLPIDDRKVNRSPTSVPGLSAHLTQASLTQQDSQPTFLQRSSAKRNVSALYRQNAQTEALPTQSGQPTSANRPYTRSQRRAAAQPQRANLPPISFSTEAQLIGQNNDDPDQSPTQAMDTQQTNPTAPGNSNLQ